MRGSILEARAEPKSNASTFTQHEIQIGNLKFETEGSLVGNPFHAAHSVEVLERIQSFKATTPTPKNGKCHSL